MTEISGSPEWITARADIVLTKIDDMSQNESAGRFDAVDLLALAKECRRARARESELEGQIEKPDEKTLSCGFCGKNQKEVAKLIAGPKVYICNECVSVCASLIPLGELIRPLVTKTTDVLLTTKEMAKFIDRLESDQPKEPAP